MSKYTTEVRYICEVAAGLKESVGFDNVWDVLTDDTVKKVFENITFPIFDEAYRVPLEKKILLHYYTREIGLETVGLWKLKMTSKLNDIMPYYNQLYESAKIDGLDFFETADYSETIQGNRKANNTRDFDETRTGKSSGYSKNNRTTDDSASSSSKSNEHNITADTPQAKIGDIEGTKTSGGVTTNKDATIFASAYDKSEAGTETTSKTNSTDTLEQTENTNSEGTTASKNTEVENTDENKTRTVKGRYGSMSTASMLKEMRETFLNIDAMIIEELSPLFMNLW